MNLKNRQTVANISQLSPAKQSNGNQLSVSARIVSGWAAVHFSRALRLLTDPRQLSKLRDMLVVIVVLISVALALPAAAEPATAQIAGPLVASGNPNYFKDANGAVLILNGSQTW